MTKQTLTDFYNEHRISIIALTCIIGFLFLIFCWSAFSETSTARCTLTYSDIDSFSSPYSDVLDEEVIKAMLGALYPNCDEDYLMEQLK